MKKLFRYCLLATSTLFISISSFADHAIIPTDSSNVPECIKKLDRPGSKGIRSYNGGMHYRKICMLGNGKVVYVFNSEASIGCNFNQPAGTKYFNDSCRYVAYFPAGFSLKRSFKPFVANGYSPDDFPEAATGDYPVYFANLAKTNAATNAKISNPFPEERTFKIGKKEDNILDFKTGDIIKISTKNGLQHFRNNQLVNNYKILPQLAIFSIEAKCRVAPCFTFDTSAVVFYLDGAERFIDIRENIFFVSAGQYSYLNKPTSSMRIPWKKGYELTEL